MAALGVSFGHLKHHNFWGLNNYQDYSLGSPGMNIPSYTPRPESLVQLVPFSSPKAPRYVHRGLLLWCHGSGCHWLGSELAALLRQSPSAPIADYALRIRGFVLVESYLRPCLKAPVGWKAQRPTIPKHLTCSSLSLLPLSPGLEVPFTQKKVYLTKGGHENQDWVLIRVHVLLKSHTFLELP